MPPLHIAAVYAHPDDGEFFAAGTLAKWALAGHRVTAICATDGALGSRKVTDDPQGERLRLAITRRRELGEALLAIGVAEPPILLNFPDGSLLDHAAPLRERLVYWFRRLRVDRVLTFDPWKRYEIHPDHITVGRMASEAAVFSCFPLLHPEHLSEGCQPHQPAEVWYMMPTEHRPNRVVDIGETFPRKVEAVLRHSSQVEMLADWFVKGADPAHLSEAERAQLQEGATIFLQGMAQGVAQLGQERGIALAEAFYALPTGPGHFRNFEEMFKESVGAPPTAPEFL